ncbi:hypothetical protein COEX109129_22685 [Corallococcus exiguus]
MHPLRVAQRTAILGLTGYSQLFIPPIPNNFTFILFPTGTDAEQQMDRVRVLNAPLNQANLLLHECCRELAARMGGGPFPALEEALEGWRRQIDGRTNLRSVEYAEAALAALDQRLSPRRARTEIARRRPDIITAFTRAPVDVKGLLRINLYLPEEALEDSLSGLIRGVFATPASFGLVERLEVAKVRVEPSIAVTYPTLILYLRAHANQPALRPRVEALLRGLASLLEPFRRASLADATYADQWHPSATATQGLRLHKRYLHLLALLSRVYDRRSNFAYLKAPPSRASSFPGVLDRVRTR